MSKINTQCSCIFCKKEFNILGFGLHFLAKHSEEGHLKLKEAAQKVIKNRNGEKLIHPKCSCIKCKSEITVSNINKHYNSKGCKRGGKHSIINKVWNIETTICQFCNKQFNSKNATVQHIIKCKHNPDRIVAITSSPSYGMRGKKHSDETKAKLSIANKNRFSDPLEREKIKIKNTGKKLSEEAKQNLRISMASAVKNYPESYSAGNQGRVKTYVIDDIKLKGLWEVDFYLWCKKNNIKVNRPASGFYYYWNGHRTYFPDFYLPDYDQYIEVKGYQTKQDDAKWLYFPHKLKIVRFKEIKQIRNNNFSLKNILWAVLDSNQRWR